MDRSSQWPQGKHSVYRNATLAATKAAAATTSKLLLNIDVWNAHATQIEYLQLFDLASADVTVGVTAPTYTFACPPGATQILIPDGLPFQTAITVAATDTRVNATNTQVLNVELLLDP